MFTPVLAKHTKNLSLVDILAVGVDRMQRNFEPMRKQVEAWKGTRLTDESAKLVIYRAFVEGELDVPKHLARRVHDLYFNAQIEEFAPADNLESLQRVHERVQGARSAARSWLALGEGRMRFFCSHTRRAAATV